MSKSAQGIVRPKGEEQPADKEHARKTHKTAPDRSASREATRDPKLSDPEKTPGSGMTPTDESEAPTG